VPGKNRFLSYSFNRLYTFWNHIHYTSLHQQITEKKQQLAIRELLEGNDEVCLTIEGHAVLDQIDHFCLDNSELWQHYFRGHTDKPHN